MEKIKEICRQELSRESQDIEKSNEMWDKRAKEFNTMTDSKKRPSYFDIFSSYAQIKSSEILDISSGAGRYMKMFLEAGAKAYGVEPSKKMAELSLKNLDKLGISKDNYHVFNQPLQDFQVERQYDYIFISNSPVIEYYENYEKIMKLAKKGIFIGSWVDRSDSLYESLAKKLNLYEKRSASYDLVYIFNLMVADGYMPEYRIIKREYNHNDKLENFIQRYTSWLYGSSYTADDVERVKENLKEFENPDGSYPRVNKDVRGVLYLDLE